MARLTFRDTFLKEATSVLPRNEWRNELVRWMSDTTNGNTILADLLAWKRSELDNAAHYASLSELGDSTQSWLKDMTKVARFAPLRPKQPKPADARRHRWAAVVRTMVQRQKVFGHDMTIDKDYSHKVATGILYTALNELYNLDYEGDQGWFISKLGTITVPAHAAETEATEARATAQTEGDRPVPEESEDEEQSAPLVNHTVDANRNTSPKVMFPGLRTKKNALDAPSKQTSAPGIPKDPKHIDSAIPAGEYYSTTEKKEEETPGQKEQRRSAEAAKRKKLKDNIATLLSGANDTLQAAQLTEKISQWEILKRENSKLRKQVENAGLDVAVPGEQATRGHPSRRKELRKIREALEKDVDVALSAENARKDEQCGILESENLKFVAMLEEAYP